MNDTSVNDTLTKVLKEMKMSAMAQALSDDLNNPNSGLDPFEERISKVIMAEYSERQNKKTQRFIKESNIPFKNAEVTEMYDNVNRSMDMATFEKLSTCQWIRDKRNLLVTGPCGCGKTWMSSALGIRACEAFLHVRYYPCSQLIMRLSTYPPDIYLQQLEKLSKLNLLILDDFGLQKYDVDSCRVFFEILDSMYKNGSLMMISQYPVSLWHDLFTDKTFANAVMSRAIGASFRLEIDGPDLRVDKQSS